MYLFIMKEERVKKGQQELKRVILVQWFLWLSNNDIFYSRVDSLIPLSCLMCPLIRRIGHSKSNLSDGPTTLQLLKTFLDVFCTKLPDRLKRRKRMGCGKLSQRGKFR
jgi:hypothetical protein